MQRESEKTSNGFLEELRSQFERDLDIKKTLDSKATTMITMSSTVITILIGIATFLITKIEPKTDIFVITLFILGIGIALATSCIICLIKSYSLRKYCFPMGHETFYEKESGAYKQNMVEKFRDASKEQFTDHMIKEYIGCIQENASSNSKKSDSIKYGQILIVGAMISITVLTGLILASIPLNWITLNF